MPLPHVGRKYTYINLNGSLVGASADPCGSADPCCAQSHNLDVAKKCLETYFLEARRCGIRDLKELLDVHKQHLGILSVGFSVDVAPKPLHLLCLPESPATAVCS